MLYYGFWCVGRYSYKITNPSIKKLKAAIIQGNIEQDRKWEPQYQEEVFKIYTDLTMEANSNKPNLMVWPEASTPFYFQSDITYRNLLLDLVSEVSSYLLFGSPAYEYTGEELKVDNIKMYNSAYLASPKRVILSKYDKIHLVPFGEYVPFRRLLFFVYKMVEGIGEFYGGNEYTVMEIPGGKFGVLICFEAIFPDLSRKFVKKGAEFLVNITNDAWFGVSAAPYQHISMAVFRAIENRVFVIRSANTGISTFITPIGEIINPTRLFERKYLIGEIVPMKDSITFYTKYGDVFAYSCVLITLFAIIMFMFRKKDKKLTVSNFKSYRN